MFFSYEVYDFVEKAVEARFSQLHLSEPILRLKTGEGILWDDTGPPPRKNAMVLTDSNFYQRMLFQSRRWEFLRIE